MFKINTFKGNQCKNINKYSRILPEQQEYNLLKNNPCCLNLYMYKVYAALKNDKVLTPTILTFLQLRTLIINLISPSKFKEGGLAMFLTLNKNHHKPILGIKFNKPFTINRLRLFIRSYTTLARQNNPEEHKPCPIITITAPLTPQ